ncbi:MAG TPA: polysaccharide biosynthesis/export family protein [Vicinamibacterales bacterium]|jgi:polysaccharide export outer membrane protein
MQFHRTTAAVVGLTALMGLPAGAQQAASKPSSTSETAASAAASAPLPEGYLIGAEDVLSIVFWQEKSMSADVIVRPDGKISLPLLNDVQAVGLTPDQLRSELVKAAAKFIADPNATVVVKEIHSRKVFITGNVTKPGTFPLTGEMNVLQLIALAGGLQEYGDSKNIVIMRNEGGRQQSFKFNYKDVIKQKHVEQNISLKPGDTVIVP